MAINLYNNAEGGSDGVTVTTGNSGGSSGTAFTTVPIGTGSLTFTSALSHTGTYCYNLTPGNGSACYLAYYFSGGSGYTTARAYVYLTGNPSAATQLMRYYSDATMVYFTMNSNGKPQIQDYTGTRIDLGGTVCPLNTWLRLELTAKPGTGTTDGYIAASIYVGDDTTAPVYNFITNSANTGTANIASYSVGKVSNSGNWATMYVDDILVQDTTYLGPANTTPVSWLA